MLKSKGIFSRIVAAALSVSIAFGVCVPAGGASIADLSFDSETCGVCDGANAGSNNYDKYDSVTRSYLTPLVDGLMRVQASDSSQYSAEVEYFDLSFNFKGCKHINKELPLFGGFFAASDGYYYLLTGQSNPTGSSSTEVFRITRYDYNWIRQGSASLYGANTITPFQYGGAAFAESNGYMLIKTCHSPIDTSTGIDQGSVFIQYSLSSNSANPNTITSVQYDNEDSTGFTYRSLGQKLLIDNGRVVSADHGDNFARGISVNFMKNLVNTGAVTASAGENVSNYIRKRVFPIDGKDGNIETGMSLGGFELSENSYLVALNSIDTTQVSEISGNNPDINYYGGVRNVYVAVVPKATVTSGEFTIGNVTVKQMTTYDSDAGAGTPKLVKISPTRFMLLWQYGDNLCWEEIDDSGAVVANTYGTAEGELSDCQPIVLSGSKVVWYTYDNSYTTFYSINLSNVTTLNKKTELTGHDLEWISTDKAGKATFTCRKCGESVTQTVPKKIWISTKTELTDSYHYKQSDIEKKSADIVLDSTAKKLYVKYETDPLENPDNREIVLNEEDYDPEMISFDSANRVITPLKVGRTTAVFRAKYNSSTTFTLNITINGQCYLSFDDQKLDVVKSDNTALANGSLVDLDSEITITAKEREGYRLKTITANGETITSGSTYTVAGDTEIEDEWFPKYVLSKPSNATVTRNSEELDDGAYVDKGEELIITVDPPVGQNLTSLTVNGTSINNGTLYVVPDLDDSEDKTVEIAAGYEDRLRLVIPTVYAQYIEVKKGSEVLTNGAYLDVGDKITVKVTPAEDKVLRSLTVNDEAVTNGAAYTLKDNEGKLVNVAVEFADRGKVEFDETVTVTRNAQPITNGTYLSQRDILKIKITPPEGKRLVKLTINGEEVAVPDSGASKNSCSYTVKADEDGIVENVVIAPDFGDKYKLEKPENVTVKRGTASLEDGAELEAGDTLIITADTPDDKRLVSLTVNGSEIKSGARHTVTGDVTVGVEYLPKFKLIKPDYITVTRVVAGRTDTLENGALLNVNDKLTITLDLPESRRLVDDIYLNNEPITIPERGYKYTVEDSDVEIFISTEENYKVYVGDGTEPDNVVIKKGSTVLSSGDYVNDGDALTVTAVPPENMRVAGLYANDEDITADGTYTVNGDDVVIEAEFAEKYKVYFPGTITVTNNGTELTTGDYIDEGDKLLITANPPENQRLAELYVNETLVTYSHGYTATVAGDVEVGAVFAEKFKITFPESITVKRNDTELTTGDYIDEEDVLTITATPPEGKRVALLKANDTELKSGGTYTVSADTTITVEYGDKFKLTIPENIIVKKGNVDLENGSLLDDDDILTVTAVPPEGLRLIWLKVNDTEISNNGTYTVVSDTEVTVLFADKYKLTVPENVTVMMGTEELGNNALIDEGDELTITAIPPEGKRLAALKANDTSLSNGGTYIVDSDTNITVAFADKFVLTFPDNVTVTRDGEELADGALTDTGEKLVITAVPPVGKRLVSLTVNDDAFTSGSTYTVAADTYVTVEFEDRNTVSIPENVTVKRNGEVLSDGAYIDPGDKLVITATAPAGKNIVALKVNDAAFKSGSTYTVAEDTVIELELTDRMKVTFPENVTVKRNGKSIASGDFVDVGDKIVITAVSPSGRTINGLFVNGEEFTSGNSHIVTGNVEVSVTYENGYLLTISENVTVKRNGTELANGSEIKPGDQLVITATAPVGMIVSTLRVNGEAEENGLTYTVTGDTTVTVEYDDDPDYSSEVKGTITLNGSGTGSVTVELYDSDGNKVKSVISENGSFDMNKLAAGEYELRISKDKYVTRIYKITAGSDPVVIDAELRQYGDITGDTITDAKDATQILRYDAGASSMIKKNGEDLNEYLVAVGCIKNVTVPDAKDANQILRFEAGMASLLLSLLGLA